MSEELRLSECNTGDGGDWNRVMQEVLEQADSVRSISFRKCDLVRAPRQQLCEMLCRLKNLQRIDVSGCGLTAAQLEEILGRALPVLPCFASLVREATPEPEPQANSAQTTEQDAFDEMEAARLLGEGNDDAAEDADSGDQDQAYGGPPRPYLRSHLNLSGNAIDNDGMNLLFGSVNCQLDGVQSLDLSYTNICDFCSPVLCKVFTYLEELHVSHTRFIGFDLSRLLKEMQNVSLVNMDSCPVVYKTAEAVRTAITERLGRALSLRPLSVWMRGVDIDGRWEDLFTFCSMPQHQEHFEVKHDLQCRKRQKTTGAKHTVEIHSEVHVELMLPRGESVKVVHPNVLATEAVHKFAKECVVAELNLVCCNDTREVNILAVRAIRKRYREVLWPLKERGVIRTGETHKVDSVQIKYTNVFTHAEVDAQPVRSRDILGMPRYGQCITVMVAAEPVVARR